MERDLSDTLHRLSEFTGDLLKAARGGDLGALDGALADRRALLDRLSGQLRAADEAGREECGAALQQVLLVDREIESLLQRRRDEIGTELQAIGHGRRGLTGYRGGGLKSSKWIDERG